LVLRQPTPGRPLRWEPDKPGDADVALSMAHLLAAISLEMERNEEHSDPELAAGGCGDRPG
jgi:hypothetical protein